tara:strand:+ start:4435 stop:5763 length:1329 start_codon:yes stop_codon:yes gene_type:complete
MNRSKSVAERCEVLLLEWLDNLVLTNLEKNSLKEEFKELQEQINRLRKRHFRLSVFGRVGVGKSSVLNALLKSKVFTTDITHGSTSRPEMTLWEEPLMDLDSIELIDTPGIDDIDPKQRNDLTYKICKESDFILFVIDGDLTTIEINALRSLIKNGKPVFLVLNRSDQWQADEINQLLTSIKNRLPRNARNLIIKTVSAAPRRSQLFPNGKTRSIECEPQIEPLRNSLMTLLKNHGELFLALNSLHSADKFYQALKVGRLKRGKLAAQSLIGKFAALKASGVAVSPILMLDISAGLVCDTALIVELSKLYGLQLHGPAARELLKRLSLYNALLGGAHYSIQLTLSVIRHMLLIASPFTGGVSLISTTPIAIAQAALAVHTTKLTGRLAAKEFLQGSHQRGFQPRSMLIRLVRKDPEVQSLLNQWPVTIALPSQYKEFSTLLP